MIRDSRLPRAVAIAAALGLAQPVLAQAAPIEAPAGGYALDTTHASLTWRVKHLGLSMYTARFASFDSEIMLDPKTPTNSSVTVSIDANSVRTDFPFPETEDFDKVVSEKFLGARENPTISFRSTSLKATGPTTGQLTGDLTLRGVTRPVTLDVTLNGAMEHPMRKVAALGFSAKGKLKRSDFGDTFLQGPVGDEVEILIEAEYLKKP
ncbi:MAG: YceI family protein [Sphingomonadaceae bacterium]